MSHQHEDDYPECPINWEEMTAAESMLYTAMRRLFASHPELLAYVFDRDKPMLRKAPEILTRDARAMSAGERILVRIALDLWNQSGGVGLTEIIERLDGRNYGNFIDALRSLGCKPRSPHQPARALGRHIAPDWEDPLASL